ncbi:hypothetical protein ANCCAN_00992 [Ancylostoma caninum]|uniref:Uncharacterized protein n=1 Tax=Ancylostoma caninum TaxID=29170 RepID=A0A368HCN5_ANCCA|nr:hypothetical protein ANCCAN_00992 [Ancylostoma caninum]
MAPRKSKVDVTPDLPPVWLEEIIKRWDSYFARFGKAQSDKKATATYDQEALAEIIESSGDPELLAEWQNRKIDLRRYPEGSTRPASERPPFTKITTPNGELRDKLLSHMRRGKLPVAQKFIYSYACKDYTCEELVFDRALRQKAGPLNQQAGKLLYVVRDRIHKLRTLCDLPTHSLEVMF